MTSRLALKFSRQLSYDNQPSFAGVALRLPGGLPTGSTVLVALDKLDNVVTFALVASCSVPRQSVWPSSSTESPERTLAIAAPAVAAPNRRDAWTN